MKTPYLLTLAALIAAAPAAFAHGNEDHATPRKFDPAQVEVTDVGQEGDPKKVTRTIQVDMADTMRFTPANLAVKRGETVRFVVRNGGQVLHEMVLGTSQALAVPSSRLKTTT